jgi:hypothetical protein
MSSLRRSAAVFVLFTVVAVVMSFPLVTGLGSLLRGTDINALGDPLLNTWTLAWDVHKLASLDLGGLFDANNFYPQKKTLLYSEHLMTQALISFPVNRLTGNPILAYNFAFLLSLILSAFGVYLLVRRLTGSSASGILGGLIYAFNPFLSAHYYQIQVITAFGIPFAFYFLHRYFEDGLKVRDLLGFTAFYILQCWANGYYALYLTLFAAIWILVQAVVHKSLARPRLWGGLALFVGLAGAFLAPFYIAYFKLHESMGFSRSIDFYARLGNFLGAPRSNLLYGRLTQHFAQAEGELFPGLAAVLLAAAAIVFLARSRSVRIAALEGREARLRARFDRGLLILLSLVGISAVAIMGSGSFHLRLFGQEIIRAHNLGKTLILFVVLAVGLVVFRATIRPRLPSRPPIDAARRNILGYAGLGLLALLLSFGPKGPYLFLYEHVPGFKALRVASRIDILIMFCLAVLAGFGLKILTRRLRPRSGAIVAAILSLVVLGEFLSVPVGYHAVSTKKDITPVYQWMARNREPGVLVELPFPYYDMGTAAEEAVRMYFSIYHWFPLVNGYSGYFPALYTELCRRWEMLPLEQLIDDFEAIGVRYMIVHFGEIPEEERPYLGERFEAQLGDIKLVERFDDDYFFEIVPRPPRTGPAASLDGLLRLPRDGWTATASVGEDRAAAAIDGDPATRWDTGDAQRPGNVFELDLGRPTLFRCLSLRFGPSAVDFPRGYSLEISADGRAWSEVAREENVILPILSFAEPKELALNIRVEPVTARYLRVTNLGWDRKFYWSIYEADLFR